MKRKTIKELEAAVFALTKSEGEWKDAYTNLKEELVKALFNDPFYSRSAYEVRQTEKSRTEIFARIGALRGFELRDGQVLPWINQYQTNEMAKLWYLARVGMKDPALKPAEFIDPVSMRKDPFTPPNFAQ